MSIVGTRPPLISETNLYEPHHKVSKQASKQLFLFYVNIWIIGMVKKRFEIDFFEIDSVILSIITILKFYIIRYGGLKR